MWPTWSFPGFEFFRLSTRRDSKKGFRLRNVFSLSLFVSFFLSWGKGGWQGRGWERQIGEDKRRGPAGNAIDANSASQPARKFQHSSGFHIHFEFSENRYLACGLRGPILGVGTHEVTPALPCSAWILFRSGFYAAGDVKFCRIRTTKRVKFSFQEIFTP